MANKSPQLTKNRIVDEAIALLDEEGAKGLSMRALAVRLGASTMATYHHIADKQALVEAIADRVMQGLAEPNEDASWQEIIRTLAHSFRDLGLAHPAAFRLMLTGDQRPAALQNLTGTTLEKFTERGFAEIDAIQVFRTLVRFMIGSSLSEERLVQFQGPEELNAVFEFGVETFIAGIEVRLDLPTP